MNITMTHVKNLTAVLALLTALGTAGYMFWPAFGWITPNAHAAAMDDATKKYDGAEQAIKSFRDEWKCDEWAEELIDLFTDLQKADLDGKPTTQIEHDIEKTKDKMKKRDCVRFEE